MVIFKKFLRSGKIQGNYRNVYVKSRKIEIKVLRTFIFLSLSFCLSRNTNILISGDCNDRWKYFCKERPNELVRLCCMVRLEPLW